MSMFDWDARPIGLCLATAKEVNLQTWRENQQEKGVRKPPGKPAKLTVEQVETLLSEFESSPVKGRKHWIADAAKRYKVATVTIERTVYSIDRENPLGHKHISLEVRRAIYEEVKTIWGKGAIDKLREIAARHKVSYTVVKRIRAEGPGGKE